MKSFSFPPAGACIFKTRTRKVSSCESTVVVISRPPSANSRCLLTRSLFHGDRAALFLSLVMNSQRNQVQVRAGKSRAAFWRKQDFPNLKRAREQRLTQLERSRPYYPVGSKELIRRVKHGWMAAVFGLRDRRSMRRSRPRTTNAPRSIGACVL